jgi:hypothetical protein
VEGEKIDRVGFVGCTECKDSHDGKVDRRHDDQDGDHKVENQQAGISTRFVLMSEKVHDVPKS